MRKKLSLAGLNPMDSKFKVRGTLYVKEFIEKQQEFIAVKRLQNLAPRTIKDYYYSFGHVNNWIKTSITDWGERTIDKQLFTSYIGYLVGKYSPATVNIRIRYLKVFLKWLYAEEFVNEDFYSRLKLLRVPLDIKKRLLRVRSVVAKSREERILPLSKKTVKYLERLLDVAVNNNELYIFMVQIYNRIAILLTLPTLYDN